MHFEVVLPIGRNAVIATAQKEGRQFMRKAPPECLLELLEDTYWQSRRSSKMACWKHENSLVSTAFGLEERWENFWGLRPVIDKSMSGRRNKSGINQRFVGSTLRKGS
jgi:hypothetical protein